jgi:hypothetical protein
LKSYAARPRRQHQLAPGDQLSAFAYMSADGGIERAPLACISAMDQTVRVAQRRAAFGPARIFFV